MIVKNRCDCFHFKKVEQRRFNSTKMSQSSRRVAVDVEEEAGELLADRAKRFATNQVRLLFFLPPTL